MAETVVAAFATYLGVSTATAAMIIQVAVIVTPALYVKPRARRGAPESLP